jgi:hypothetical protein
MLPEVLAGQIL